MLFYYLFWMLMGLFIHFYIIFGTNLLTQGPVQIVVFFAYFSVSKEMNIKRSPNGMKHPGAIFLEQTWSRGLGVDVKQQRRRPRGCPVRPYTWARPPLLWAPRASTDLLLPPIYTHIPREHQNRSRKPISTVATFCTQGIPSWGHFRSSAAGGIDHGELLHQHHSLSDDVWVVYLRPSGP